MTEVGIGGVKREPVLLMCSESGRWQRLCWCRLVQGAALTSGGVSVDRLG